MNFLFKSCANSSQPTRQVRMMMMYVQQIVHINAAKVGIVF